MKRLGQGLASVGDVPRLTQQAAYLQREVARLQAENRRLRWQSHARVPADAAQTKASFDFQWTHLPSGNALPSDEEFMARVAQDLLVMTGRPRDWFAGRSVVDIGCGLGRYTYGFLQLGAHVTACDQSPAALARTAELCARFGERLRLKQVDLLEWDEEADFDLAFSFGVVHHTGNTYRAIENVGRKLREGGRLFLMVYNMPEDFAGYHDVNAYDAIAAQNEGLTFEERRRDMVRRFGKERAHGWFDATSPRINDRLTFSEIRDLLAELGFINVAGRIVARDHYVTADRALARPLAYMSVSAD
jgi:SAM-dependent methyltransferase